VLGVLRQGDMAAEPWLVNVDLESKSEGQLSNADKVLSLRPSDDVADDAQVEPHTQGRVCRPPPVWRYLKSVNAILRISSDKSSKLLGPSEDELLRGDVRLRTCVM
jgi:hypothetical protein